MLTTAGFNFSAKSANDEGAVAPLPGEAAMAFCTGDPKGIEEKLTIPTKETTKTPTKNTKKKERKRVLLFVSFSIMNNPPLF
jgi:hypothetical protein